MLSQYSASDKKLERKLEARWSSALTQRGARTSVVQVNVLADRHRDGQQLRHVWFNHTDGQVSIAQI
jgi:hypothetical protein